MVRGFFKKKLLTVNYYGRQDRYTENTKLCYRSTNNENEMQFADLPTTRINNKYGEPLSLICDEKFSLYSSVVRFLLGRQIA